MNDTKRIDLSRQHDRAVDIYESDTTEGEHGSIVVSENIRIPFNRFVRMLKTHDLSEVLDVEEESEQTIVIPAELLADIANSQVVIEKRAATTNIYSGIFLYGLGVGLLIALVVAIGFSLFSFSVEGRDLIIVAGVLLTGLLLPFMIIATEPTINDIQERHRDYLERVTSFLSKR